MKNQNYYKETAIAGVVKKENRMLKTLRFTQFFALTNAQLLVYLRFEIKGINFKKPCYMNKVVMFIAVMFFLVACKKETKQESVSSTSGSGTTATASNTVTWFVQAYDSVGDQQADRSNINVSFLGTSFSGVTNLQGVVTMTGVPAGNLIPVLNKPGYEYAPYSVAFNAANPFSLNALVARNSPYKLTLTSQPNLINKDSITINFFLNKAIPVGKSIKIAVLTSTASTVGVNDYSNVDYLFVSGGNTNFTNKNIAKLNNIANFLSGLSTWQKGYFAILPVTYGSVFSNTLNKQVLIGDNIPVQGSPTSTMQITKNW